MDTKAATANLAALKTQLACSANDAETKQRLYGYAKKHADMLAWTLRFLRGAKHASLADFAPGASAYLKAFDALPNPMPQPTLF